MPLEVLYHYGLFLLFPTALLLTAGLGWKKAAAGLTLAIVIAVAGALVAAFVFGAIASANDHSSGEWRGMNALAGGILGFFGGFIVTLIGALVWLVKTRRLSTERTVRSQEFIGAAGVGFAIVLFCFANVIIGSTPAAASTQRLVEQVDNYNSTPESLNEIVRRGPDSVPFILAVLRRYPYAQKDDHLGRGSVRVAPQLDLLSQIGGAEPLAELQRWADADSWDSAKAAALCGLAANGDPKASERIGDFLGTIKYAPQYSEAKLFRALGKLKASDQVGAIHARLDKLLESLPIDAGYDADVKRHSVRQLAKDGFLGTHAYLQAGIIALGEIDTENAQVALEKFQKNPERRRRALITTMLEDCPGEHSTKLLAKALDDPEPLVRENAYVALWHRNPALQNDLKETWSASNEQMMRERSK